MPARRLAQAILMVSVVVTASGLALHATEDGTVLDRSSRAGRDWWSLQPIRRPTVPIVNHNGNQAHAIDAFILDRLRAHGLDPSPRADRRTLIRRVTFDLIGLPPTPDEVSAFLSNPRPDRVAYAAVVDRLLRSPHYGERWARHWLDVIRFGESQGFERDKLRTNSWQYRDWVIQSLNDDMPYDEFVRMQVAGDVLKPDDPRGVIATGFLVAGAWDEVGQLQQSAAMKAVVRQDELEDIVGVTGQTFLGLTIHCARCHDHKFDPITQVDYYRFCAALAGVRHGERPTSTRPIAPELQATLKALDTRRAELKSALAVIDDPVRDSLAAAQIAAAAAHRIEPPTPIARWEFDGDLNDSIGTLHGTAQGHARVQDGRLHIDGRDSFVSTPSATVALAAKTLEAWVSLANTEQRGGGVLSIEVPGGSVFDAIVYGEREPGQWMAGSNSFVRSLNFDGTPLAESADTLVHIAIVYANDGQIAAYRNGAPYGTPYQSNGLQSFEPGGWQVLFGLRHNPPGGNRFLTGSIERAQLYDRALTAAEIAASYGTITPVVTEDAIVAQLPREVRGQRAKLVAALSQIELDRRLLIGESVYAVSPKPPEPVHVLERGDTRLPRERVTAGGIASLIGPSADFELPTDATDADRRARLAAWITDPHNPLTARVIANRLWHYHFGAGLVDSPNDFGWSGGRPTHPKLLDWLAAELISPEDVGSDETSVARQNTNTQTSEEPNLKRAAPPVQRFSLKHLHRLIVNSDTYCQSSQSNLAAARFDADNRLLWRHTPVRLDAESVRDSVLAVSGELNPAIGGRGYQDFRTSTNNSQFYEMIDPIGYSFQRRTIYRTWARSGTNPLLDVFDCPDPSTTAPKRAMTTTPLQALSLLNDSFMLRMADRMATRLTDECGLDLSRQIQRAYELAVARAPSDAERAAAVRLASEHGTNMFCRVLLNCNEFLYVD